MKPTVLPPRPLTLAFVRHVTAPGKYYDNDGLILVVSPTGAKSWLQRLTVLGRRRDIGLGSALAVSPSAARKIAAKNKAVARAGGNPMETFSTPEIAVKPQRVMTVSLFALTIFRREKAKGKKLKAATETYQKIKAHVIPVMGDTAVAVVTPTDIRTALAPVFDTRNTTGEALQDILVALFDVAVEEKLRIDNPARSPEAAPSKRRLRTTLEGDARNQRVFDILPAFMRDLRETKKRFNLVRMVRFIALSLRHPKECRLITWSQIDVDKRLWCFPSMQIEGRNIVEIRLHDGLMAIIEEMTPLRRGDGTGWLFPNSVDYTTPYSLHATQKITDDFGYDLGMRDFVRVFEWRRSVVGGGYDAADWCRDLTGEQRT